ncbi:MAG: glycerate kinase, partial [Gammaproteobacteria bacterium]
LTRIPAARRDPLRASTLGTGQLMRHALERGARRIVVGVGGSATNDGGAGMLQGLGVRFFDRSGAPLTHALGGGDLSAIADFDAGHLTSLMSDVGVEVMCDVDNTLCGPHGASATFGPQKGADARTVQQLDRGLDQFFALVEEKTGAAVKDRSGAGAAGGLAAALMALCGARARPGIEFVLEAVGFDQLLDGAALVITAEGCVDGQTGAGKAPLGVARAAAARGVPVLVIGGALADDAEGLLGVHFDAMEAAVTRPQALSDALAGARDNLERAGQRVGAWLRLARRLAPRDR